MVREDLINSAVTFLHDPSVAQAPIDKKIAFLQSKNLTQEEIDVALARAGDGSASVASPVGPPANYQYRPPYPQQAYPPYPPYGFQQPPPEVPKRDWRDWFIMATVVGGVGYGIYFTAKRYIVPLIAPPTPPQLEQDKQTIDESFEKAFTLLEQLNADTEALKAAEQSRTERLDSALLELESVLSSLKEADRKREDDSKRNADEIRSLRDLIPRALEGQKDATETRLKSLGEELKSLSKLISNRVGGSSTTTPAPATTTHRPTSSASGNTLSAFHTNGTSGARDSSSPVPPSPSTNGNVVGSSSQTQSETAAPAEGSRSSTPSGLSSRFGSGGKASIPVWQMAAAKKSTDGLKDETKKDTSASGTAVDATA